MLLDTVDVELLRLVGCYGLIDPCDLTSVGLADAYHPSMLQLLSSGIIEYCGPEQKKKYLRLSDRGEKLLLEHGFNYKRYINQSLREGDVRRVIETARVALLCHRAGIDILNDTCDALEKDPVFIQSKPLRRELHNSVSSAVQCSGFGNWGEMAFMVYFATPEGYGPFMQHENALIHRLCPYYGKGFDMPFSIAACGKSYAELYELLKLPPPPKKKRNGQITYAEAYQRSKRPYHLVAFSEAGATQLALMRRKDHRQKVANLILGKQWAPAPRDVPEADGVADGIPITIGIDMNLRRITGACQTARERGYPMIRVAALTSQVDEVLAKLLPLDGVEILYFEPEDLETAFEGSLLHTPVHAEYRGPGGRGLLV